MDGAGRTVRTADARTDDVGNGSPSTLYLNTNGAFYNDTVVITHTGLSAKTVTLKVGGDNGYTGKGLGAQMLILLHEFAHTIEAIPHDNNDSTQSDATNKDLLQKCKDEIDAAVKAASGQKK